MVKRLKCLTDYPVDAKLAYQGVYFSILSWEQEMFDGTKEVFEVAKKADSVSVIAVTEEKKILFLEESQPGINSYFSMPGGHLDFKDEDLIQAGLRELREETGYTSSDIELWFQFQPAVKIDYVSNILVARGCKRVDEVKELKGERIKVLELEFDELLEKIRDERFYNLDIKLELLLAQTDLKRMEKLRALLYGS